MALKDMGALMRERARAPKPKRAPTEHGELVEFFYKEVLPTWDPNKIGRNGKKIGNLTFGRMAKKLEGQDVSSLRFMQSVFRDTQRRRGTEAAVKEMFWSINPNKHQKA